MAVRFAPLQPQRRPREITLPINLTSSRRAWIVPGLAVAATLFLITLTLTFIGQRIRLRYQQAYQ